MLSQELSSDAEMDENDKAISKIHMCLSKTFPSSENRQKNPFRIEPPKEDDNAMNPDYLSTKQDLLTMIKDNTSKENLFQPKTTTLKSFMNVMETKKISTENNTFVAQNSNSTYLFVSNENKSNIPHKPDSDDSSKFNLNSTAYNPKTLPQGSIFSFINNKS